MTTATIISPVSAESMTTLGHRVYSSAMQSWALIASNDDEPILLVLFREGGPVYRYAFKDWAAAREWDAIRHDEQWAADEGAEPVSWGRCFHAFLREGLILPIAA
jgi:hypothetical protein